MNTRAADLLHGAVESAHVEVDLDALCASKVEVPVWHGNKDDSADDVAKQAGDYALPDVNADGDLRVAEPDSQGHEVHVGNLELN